MKNKKGNVAVIAIIIVVVAITVGVIGWLFAKNLQAPTPQPMVTQTTAPVAQTQPAVQRATPASQPSVQPVQNDETTSWQTYKNDKYGIEFKYPAYLQFVDSAEVENPTGILHSITATYDNAGGNYFYFTINDKTGDESGSDKGIDVSISLGKNIHIKKEIIVPDGKIILTDGIGTLDYYFMDAYYKGNTYNYEFELSSPKYSKEILDLFEKIITTTRFIK